MITIDDFSGRFEFLSNFHVDFDGFCVERVYQALKPTDPTERDWIMAAATPKEAKRRGKRVRSLRRDWESVKVDVMRRLLRVKFEREHLRSLLLATGDATLIEGNWWKDRFWGQCPVGQGENWLGRLLMELRDELRACQKKSVE